MNQALPTHPEKSQLVAFGMGKLEPSEASWIEEHLGQCPTCCETLVDLKDDTFVSLVRTAEPPAGGKTEGPVLGGSSDFDKTLLVESGEPSGPADMPAELRDHPRYRVVELIGRGGMGNVYQAEHRLMNRPVALKLINSQLIRHRQAVERFRREVQAAAQLRHPNIVTAYDAEQAGDVHFLVMEFVAGTDLAARVQQNGPLPVAEACDYIRQAAEGLEHASSRGVIHRDIKPHNLMLTPQGQIRILDFGLAGLATEAVLLDADAATATSGDSSLTTHGSVMGTPDYISPEQLRDAHSADIRSDIYSLGCTLWFLLTGKPLFAAPSVAETLKAHATQPPPRLDSVRTDVPRELASVVARMIAKDPADRYQTPALVAAALAPFARAASRPQRTFSRRAIVAATALMLGLTVALGGVVVIVTDRGVLEINSLVDDVKVVVSQGGKHVATIDAKTGSQVRWLPSGKYEIELEGDDNGVVLDKSIVRLTRFGKDIVTAQWNPADIESLRAFTTKDQPITQDGVAVEDDGWRIDNAGGRTVRLFELAPPKLGKGQFFYRAQMKTKDVQGKAYIEMWVRFPGKGEFFSKGFPTALTGTNGWSQVETPFLLEEGQQPDFIRLNVVAEGPGTVWIKDVEVRGRLSDADRQAKQSRINAAVLDEAERFLKSQTSNGNSLPTALLERNGKVALRFGQWLLVFEGVPCNSHKTGVLGYSNIHYPLKGASGEGTVDFGTGIKDFGVLIRYKFDGEKNELTVNNYPFTLTGKGTRLAFKDKTYAATERPAGVAESDSTVTTIVISRDGSTRQEK